MTYYDQVLQDPKFLALANQIEGMLYQKEGKLNCDHGLTHFKRVANYVEEILKQLGKDERTIELGKVCALLHDIGIVKEEEGVSHAHLSSEMFSSFLTSFPITEEELEMMKQAIYDHSSGENIQSDIGAALLLADKLDVTDKRVEKATIASAFNQEIFKIKKIEIAIDENTLCIHYHTSAPLDIEVMKYWDKWQTIPKKVAHYYHKQCILLVNGEALKEINQN